MAKNARLTKKFTILGENSIGVLGVFTPSRIDILKNENGELLPANFTCVALASRCA